MVYLFYLLNPIFNFELTQYKKSETNSLLIQQHFQLDLIDYLIRLSNLFYYMAVKYGEWEITTFCKILLHAKKKKSTPDFIVYGELGQFPLGIYVKLRIINYWNRITNRETRKEKIPAILYNSSLLNYGTNITYLG